MDVLAVDRRDTISVRLLESRVWVHVYHYRFPLCCVALCCDVVVMYLLPVTANLSEVLGDLIG